MSSNVPLAWNAIKSIIQRSNISHDLLNGPASSQSRLRLFGKSKSSVRVTLYRDNHAWCPYCQKIWFWLEEKRVPYRVSKVTMFCYGNKERWFKKKVRSGMLPALEIDGELITESDVILSKLEETFGTMAWCQWLCYRQTNENNGRLQFTRIAQVVDKVLASSSSSFFLSSGFSIVDTIFVPYMERMNASLYYYKGFHLRNKDDFPGISDWFEALESRPVYKYCISIQSDFHTHAHDLPPQMGGCYESGDKYQQACKLHIDECVHPTIVDSKEHSVARVYRHRNAFNNMSEEMRKSVDVGLRCVITNLLTNTAVVPPSSCVAGTDAALRYLRDRMYVVIFFQIPILFFIKILCMRMALEETASSIGTQNGPCIPKQHRRDQNPDWFNSGGEVNGQWDDEKSSNIDLYNIEGY
eukprot:GSMAST32.ASY1.ANO1.2176.1 assembled CDS